MQPHDVVQEGNRVFFGTMQLGMNENLSLQNCVDHVCDVFAIPRDVREQSLSVYLSMVSIGVAPEAARQEMLEQLGRAACGKGSPARSVTGSVGTSVSASTTSPQRIAQPSLSSLSSSSPHEKDGSLPLPLPLPLPHPLLSEEEKGELEEGGDQVVPANVNVNVNGGNGSGSDNTSNNRNLMPPPGLGPLPAETGTAAGRGGGRGHSAAVQPAFTDPSGGSSAFSLGFDPYETGSSLADMGNAGGNIWGLENALFSWGDQSGSSESKSGSLGGRNSGVQRSLLFPDEPLSLPAAATGSLTPSQGLEETLDIEQVLKGTLEFQQLSHQHSSEGDVASAQLLADIQSLQEQMQSVDSEEWSRLDPMLANSSREEEEEEEASRNNSHSSGDSPLEETDLTGVTLSSSLKGRLSPSHRPSRLRERGGGKGDISPESSKTSLCKFYQAGYCRLGSACNFSHVDPDDDNDNDRSRGEKKGSICYFFQKGKCKNGKNCRFQHVKEKR